MTPKKQATFRILRAVELNPGLSQRELAKLLGVSNGKANYLIAALIEKGLIKMGNFQQRDGKLYKIAYLLTPSGIRNRAELTRNYLVRKEAEYEALKAEIESLRQCETELLPDCLPALQGNDR